MVIGTISWFDEKKGYGFIKSEGIDHFTHVKAIQTSSFKKLQKGQVVQFVPFKGVKGMEAHDVSFVSDRAL
jgi:cold shock protein